MCPSLFHDPKRIYRYTIQDSEVLPHLWIGNTKNVSDEEHAVNWAWSENRFSFVNIFHQFHNYGPFFAVIYGTNAIKTICEKIRPGTRGSRQLKLGAVLKSLLPTWSEEIPENCGSSASAEETTSDYGQYSNASTMSETGSAGGSAFWDNCWGPWIFGLFWARSLDGSWKIQWFATY